MDIDFAGILKDDATYPDALEVTLGDKRVALGTLRDLSKREQARVADELSRATAERTSYEAKNREVVALSEKAASIYEDLQKKLAEASTRQPNPGDPEALWDSDPWYGPARKRVSSIQATVDQLAATQKQLATAMQGAIGLYMDDRWENEYARVTPELDKYPKLAEYKDIEKLKKYAADNNLVDKRKMPSIAAAVERLTVAEREAAKSNEAYERGLREGQLRARLGAQARPASAAAAISTADGKPAATFEEAMSPESVASDSELNEMLANMGINQ
jgi:hypothetical protein